MKLLIKNTLLIFLIFHSACDNVTDFDGNTLHESKIVVQGELRAGSIFEGIHIQQSVPIELGNYTKPKILSDAVVYLRIDSNRVVPLIFDGSEKYTPRENITIDEEASYELFGNCNGKNFYAKTTIPKFPIVTSATIEDDYTVSAEIRANGSEVYTSIYELRTAGGSLLETAGDFGTVTGGTQNELVLCSTVIVDALADGSFNDRIFVRVYAWDQQFEAYFETKDNSKAVENVFLQSGGQVKWNVHGENVIGMFIGFNVSGLVRVQQ